MSFDDELARAKRAQFADADDVGARKEVEKLLARLTGGFFAELEKVAKTCSLPREHFHAIVHAVGLELVARTKLAIQEPDYQLWGSVSVRGDDTVDFFTRISPSLFDTNMPSSGVFSMHDTLKITRARLTIPPDIDEGDAWTFFHSIILEVVNENKRWRQNVREPSAIISPWTREYALGNLRAEGGEVIRGILRFREGYEPPVQCTDGLPITCTLLYYPDRSKSRMGQFGYERPRKSHRGKGGT